MDAGNPKGRAKSEINVTPLIDIVLVLLIVFIVMVPSLSKVLPVSVPRVITPANPPANDLANQPVVITVLRSGNEFQYLLQSTPLKLSELPDRLTPVLLRQVPGLRKVFLKIDGEAPYQAAVNVLDQIRLASDQAKRETRAKTSADGGDAKVVISLKKS
jgi:biopolymer transport protein ExbD